MRLPSYLWALLALTAAVFARSQRHESDPSDLEEDTESDPSFAFGSMTPSVAPTPYPSLLPVVSTSTPTTAVPSLSPTESPTEDDVEEAEEEGLENNDRFNPVDGDNGLSTNGIVGVVLGSGALILAAIIIRKRQSDADTQPTPADDSIL